jgi:hypothetical protein
MKKPEERRMALSFRKSDVVSSELGGNLSSSATCLV